MTLLLEDREAYARGWRDGIAKALCAVNESGPYTSGNAYAEIRNVIERLLAPPATPSETPATHATASGEPCDGPIHSPDAECAGCCVRCGWMKTVHGVPGFIVPVGAPATPLFEAFKGAESTVLVSATPPAACATCHGSGFMPGGDGLLCEDCAGTGRDGRAR